VEKIPEDSNLHWCTSSIVLWFQSFKVSKAQDILQDHAIRVCLECQPPKCYSAELHTQILFFLFSKEHTWGHLEPSLLCSSRAANDRSRIVYSPIASCGHDWANMAMVFECTGIFRPAQGRSDFFFSIQSRRIWRARPIISRLWMPSPQDQVVALPFPMPLNSCHHWFIFFFPQKTPNFVHCSYEPPGNFDSH